MVQIPKKEGAIMLLAEVEKQENLYKLHLKSDDGDCNILLNNEDLKDFLSSLKGNGETIIVGEYGRFIVVSKEYITVYGRDNLILMRVNISNHLLKKLLINLLEDEINQEEINKYA